MNIKVRTNISSEFQDIEICINAPERNEIVQTLENELLSKSLKSIQQIVAMQDNDIFIINVSDIILFFGEEKNNFCKTKVSDFGLFIKSRKALRGRRALKKST